jgi:Resolvase, N terminal domain
MATTPAEKAMFQMMGVFAEFERAMIRERVEAALERARVCPPTIGAATKAAVRGATGVIRAAARRSSRREDREIRKSSPLAIVEQRDNASSRLGATTHEFAWPEGKGCRETESLGEVARPVLSARARAHEAGSRGA